MYISELELTNFRNFKNAKFKFKQGVNTLIGENSSGKSNVLYAIRLLLDENLPFNATKLLETDFNQNIDDWKGHWIVLKLTFKNLDSSEAASFVAHHSKILITLKSRPVHTLYISGQIKWLEKFYLSTQNKLKIFKNNEDTSELKTKLNNF